MLKGGCVCGEVRYESKGKPQFSFHCQCRRCQRITGTGHASQLLLSVNDTVISGDLKYYDHTPVDGNTVSSGFCPNCGCPVLTKTSGYPELLFFHAASLDDPSVFEPQKVVWSSSKQVWDYVDPQLEVE